MISSMTGFARQERTGAFGTLVCEIRSVNHRFLDATVRLPDSCRALETELRQTLAASKVDVGLSVVSGRPTTLAFVKLVDKQRVMCLSIQVLRAAW